MLSSELAQIVSSTWPAAARILRDYLVSVQSTDDLVSRNTNSALRQYSDLIAASNYAAGGGTASALLVPPTEISETAIAALVQTQDAYVERQRKYAQSHDAADDHQSRYVSEWRLRAKAASERSGDDLLLNLWQSGLSWRDIARLLKVSVAAIQKWRTGERMSPNSFARLRDFVAAYDTVAANKPGVDVASWIDVPILTDVPVTPRDLWIAGEPNTFFEYAIGDLEPAAALDAFDQDWRHRYRRDGFETFVADDGNLSISVKNR